MEFFSPPYLFRGARPTMASPPSSVSYGQPFTVSTPDAACDRKSVDASSGRGLHTPLDMNQRFVELAFMAGDGLLDHHRARRR